MILLVADVPGWAWDIKARAIISNLPDHEFELAYVISGIPRDLSRYSCIFYFGWNECMINKNICCTSISSHNFYLLSHNRSRISELRQFSRIATVSKELYGIVSELNDNVYYCANGVDVELFNPDRKEVHDKFTVAWVGQKLDMNATLSGHPLDMKGARFILKPLLEKLSVHDDIAVKINDNNHRNAIKHVDMPGFYSDVDLLINTSYREGTPNPLFEASAMGIPFISTGVGCVPELHDGNNGYVFEQYSRESEAENLIEFYYDKILFLKNNRERCVEMGEHNRVLIERDWDWKIRAQAYKPVFGVE